MVHSSLSTALSHVQAAGARKLTPAQRERLLGLLQEGSTCGLCNDVAEDPVIATCAHVFCQQCLVLQACLSEMLPP